MHITVYAAASGQVPEVYTQAATRLGELLAARNHTLINGAGRTGLMGATADACLANGGQAIGIIPQFMIDEAWQHDGMSQLIVTPNMHERKNLMAQRADACIACPGGVGTLEELLEVITWKQLGLYLNPIVILNTKGYFAPLLSQLESCIDQRFMRRVHGDIWKVASTPEEAIELCESTPAWDTSIRRFAAL